MEKSFTKLKIGDFVRYNNLIWQVYSINKTDGFADIYHHIKGYWVGRSIKDLEIIK